MRKNLWAVQITRTAMTMVVSLTLGMLVSSCHDSYQDAPPVLTLRNDESSGTPTRGGRALSPPERAEPVSGREPAVLFVAYVATPPDVIDRMLKLAKITKNDVVYDLGCGDGRIVITAAKKYGCRAVGYDLDHLRVEEARENARKERVARLVTIEQQDILRIDLQPATVVTLYLGTELNARLIPQLRKLKPGTRIVSHDFGLGTIRPDKAVEMTSRADGRKHTIYLWTCPLPSESK
jgi:SAM-dependent methyltransferase